MSQQPLRVLLVDDEASLREPLAKHLRQTHSCAVDTAATAEEALGRLEQAQGQYEVVLIDDLLAPAPGREPEPQGVALTKEIKARYPQVEVIVFTGWGMKSGLAVLRAGAYRYLAKPFNKEELGMLIQMAAEHSRLKGVDREKQILEQLMRTSPALLSGRDLQEVLDSILQGVKAIGFDRVCLYLLSEGDQTMIGEAQVGMDTEFVGHERPVATDPQMQIVLADPRPHVFERESNEPLPFERELGREGVKQWACVPLVLQGKVIGKLSIDNKFSQRPIVETELGPVGLFAAQAAATIEKARLRDKEREATWQAEQRTRQLEVLHQINAHITAALNLDEMLQVTLREGLQAINTDEGSIMLVSPTTNELEFKAWLVEGEFVADQPDWKLALDEGIAGYVATTGEAYNCPDVSKDTQFVGAFTGRRLRSLLSVPIVSHGRVLGTINADSKEACFFTEDDMQFLIALANHVAVAIESQRLRDVGLVSSTLILDEILAKIVESACVLSGTEFGTISLIDQKSGAPVRVAKFPDSREPKDGPRKEGGLTYLVTNSGESVVILDVQRDARVKQFIKDEGVNALLGIPLKIQVERADLAEVRTIGALFVYTTQQRDFSSRDLELLQSLANQAAIAIEKTRLYEEVALERDRSEWLTSQLLALTAITREIQLELDLPNLLNLISRLATDLLEADAGGILLLDDEKQHLTFKGAYGLGQKIVEGTRDKVGASVAGRVVELGESIIANDIPNNAHFYNPAANEEGLLAIISTPLRVRGEIIGTLDVHSKSNRFAFNEDDLQILSLMATQAAIAIQKAGLFEQTNRRAQALEALHQTALEITSYQQDSNLLSSILERAVKLLRVKGGRLYLLDESGQRFRLVAASDELEHLVGSTWEVSNSAIGQAIKTKAPVFVSDYRNWPHRVRQYDKYNFREVIAAPIIWRDRTWGAISINDEIEGRTFDEEDQKLLWHFGNLAAVALENAELIAREADKLRRLEQLAQANNEIMGNLGTMMLDERLNLIARHAAEILQAEACGIFLVRHADFLSLEASYGHREESFEKGREYAIQSGSQTGLTGHIAHEGKLFNASGEELNGHFAVRREEPHTVSKECHSLLAIPLKDRRGSEEKLIGLLRADNKKDRTGQAGPTVGFTQEDEWILSLLANAVVVAIEGARLVDQLSEQKEHLTRLLASSPYAVIANDPHGSITFCNERAQEILKYPSEEVLISKHVTSIYDDPQEPHRVGQLLDATLDNKLANHDTFLRSRENERIPIRLSITRLYDARGKHTTTVGYFEDLRIIRETERRLELLLKASNTVAHAKNLTDGLQSLAEMIVTFLDVSFCRSYLLAENQQSLIAKAGFPATSPTDQLDRSPVNEEVIIIDQWPDLAEVLTQGNPKVLRIDHDQHCFFLAERSRWLGLKKEIQSLLLIPLKIRDKIVGLLGLGELRPWGQASISEQKQELAIAIADQTTIFIDRMHLFHETEVARERLRSFYEASNTLISSQDPEQVLKEIVEQAREAANANGGSMILIDRIGQARYLATVGTDEPVDTKDLIRPDGLSMQVMHTGQPEVIEDTDKERGRVNPSMFWCGIAAALCLPVSLEGERIGVMWLHYDKPRRFPEFEIEALQLYVNQAAIAHDSARRITELKHLHQAAEALASVAKPEDVLRQIVWHAREVLQADSASVSVYDATQEKFILKGSIAIGIPKGLWQQFCKNSVWYSQADTDVMEQGWVGVEDVTDEQKYMFLEDWMQEFYQQVGLRSFQGITLAVGEERLGVLYVNYNATRSFSEEEQQIAQTFANHAALALKKANLLDEVRKAHNAARVVAEVTVLEDLESTLKSIVKEIRPVLGCDVVTLYSYDPEREKFVFPPAMMGVKHSDEILESGRVPAHSVVRYILSLDDLNVAENRMADPRWQDSFAEREDIKSSAGIPLLTREYKVGVMIVSYRNQHHFTDDEQDNIRLFAYQAAVAIRNAQLYERIQKRAGMRQALYEASRIVTRSLDLKEILDSIVEQAPRLIKYQGKQVSFACLRLVEGRKSRVVAAYPADRLLQAQATCGDELDLNSGRNGRVGITGRVAITGEPQLAGDVSSDPDYLECNPETRSELAVPIKLGSKVIGVINVEAPEYDAFDGEDQQALQSLAAQAAIAIHNASLYQEKEDHARQMAAIAKIGRTINVSLDLNTTLNTILASIRSLIDYRAAEICVWDDDQQAMAVHGQAGDPRYTQKANGIYGLKEGCTGWIVQHRQSLLITDTLKCNDVRPKVVDPDRPIRAFVGVLLQIGDNRFGTLELVSDAPYAFDENDEKLLGVIGEHAIIAIKNAQQYDALRRQSRHRQAVYEASKVISAGITAEQKQLLDRILEQAVERIRPARGDKALLGVIQLYDEASNELRFESIYPQEHFRVLEDSSGRRLILDRSKSRIGISGRTILEQRPQRVLDVCSDPDYVTINKTTLSELDVPLLEGHKVLGNLGLESDQLAAFDEEDERALQSLAELAVIAIQNARLFEEAQRRARLLDAAAQVARGATAILEIDELLHEAVRLISECFNFYHAAVFLLDDGHEHAVLRATYPNNDDRLLKPNHKLRVGREGIVGFVAQAGKPHLAPDVSEDPYYLANLPFTRAEMAFPLQAWGQVIGVLDAQSDELGDWRDEDVATLQTMADQLANAIHNAQLYQQVSERLEEATILQQVAASLAGAAGLNEVLELILTGVRNLTNINGNAILLWDAQSEKFTRALRTDEEGRFQPYTTRARTRGGRARQIIDERRPIAISDAQQMPNLNPAFLEKGYRASLGVPLLSQGEAIGLLYIRDKEPRPFSNHQIALMETLASQAAVAIDRARQYEELKQTKGLVGARTAVAWMGMVSSTWRHAIEGHAMTIREEIENLRVDSPQEYLDKIEKRLAKIKQLADKILDKPITPPLSEEEGVVSVPVNTLLRERMRQLWENEPYKPVRSQLNLELDNVVTVRASPEWLRRIFDVLVDNAVEAMASVSSPVLTITTRAVDTDVEIVFTDTGRGISKDARAKLFHKQIEKPKGTTGLGMGLLMAQTIAQTYGGEIRVESTSPSGTSMIVSLPIEEVREGNK